MFMDKTKTKFAIIQNHYYKGYDSTAVREMVFDKKTKELIRSNSIILYDGEPNINETWKWYDLSLNLNGKENDIEYLTEDQYKNCWTPECDMFYGKFEPYFQKKFMKYEQDKHGIKRRPDLFTDIDVNNFVLFDMDINDNNSDDSEDDFDF